MKPYLLADIGEGEQSHNVLLAFRCIAKETKGITECQIIQWFVKPGDKVEQFEAICEVQSDKATVEVVGATNLVHTLTKLADTDHL